MPSNNRNRRNSVDSITSAHEHDSDYVPSDSEWDDDRAWEEANLVEEPVEKQPVTRQRTALVAAKTAAAATTTANSTATKRAPATSNTARKSARIQAARK